ncbi:MAG TPA: AMP-binding protein [Micromonosporaceae bacterium]
MIRDLPFVVATLARRGLLTPGPPHRMVAQLYALARWGFGLSGELRSAAARGSDRVALIDDDRVVTYGELVSRSERLAGSLRDAVRLREGNRIGLLCRNHAAMVEAMVAANLLGADAVLVNTGLSATQLAAVAKEQTLRALVHDDEFASIVAALPPGVARIDEARLDPLTTRGPGGALPRPGRDGHTIVLTSGTTGTPKGARRPTPGGFGPLCSILDRIPMRAGDRMLIAAPLFHTWGYAALQIAIALRGTAVLRRRFDPSDTVTTMVEHRCAALFAVPVMIQRLLDAGAPPASRDLRVVAVSGSALPGGLATRFMDAYGDVLYNLYGSTEASWASIATPAELRRVPGTAGRPPHGTRVAILDDAGRSVPNGAVGHIFVGNDMLFEGYTGGPIRDRRAGLLDTGDVGHVDAAGLVYVDGREDDMIVSGGENVFPGEVEDLLAGLPQVRDVAVIGVPDEEFGQRLAAYLVLRDGERLDADAVRQQVRRNLARFSVPRDVFFVAELPRNATGKVVPRDLPRG